MRVEKWINVCNVVVDSHSISEQTFDLACKIRNKVLPLEKVPPIKVVRIQGAFKLKDGRHRITAYKLLGEKKIKAKYYEG